MSVENIIALLIIFLVALGIWGVTTVFINWLKSHISTLVDHREVKVRMSGSSDVRK